MIKKIFTFMTDTIFHKNISEYRHPVLRWTVQQYKLLFYTAKGLVEHGTMIRTASLTFYSMMSIIPIVALIFAIVKGFGLTDRLLENLYDLFPQNPEIIKYIVEFAEKALARTQGGVVAFVGVVLLFWSVIKVFSSVENAFNNIWEVKITRSVTRQYTDYIAVVVIVPLLWLMAGAMMAYAGKLLPFADSYIYVILSKVLSLVIMWIMFTFMYTIIPNTKVTLSSALTAGVVAGTIFMLFQWGYIYIQQWMTSYNTIYGSFAALPLFLIWLQTSWQIVLFGGELSFAYQNIARFGEERESLLISFDNRKKVMLAIMIHVSRKFHIGEGGTSSSEIINSLNLPTRIINDLIHALVRFELLAVIKDSDTDRNVSYIPAKDIGTMTVCTILDDFDRSGEKKIDFTENDELNRSNKLIDNIKIDAQKSSGNVKLLDLLNMKDGEL